MKSFAIITTCMNRSPMLRVSLQSWICNPLISEILIVDWSSTDSLDWASLMDPRIRVIRVDYQLYFNLSKALNIGIKACLSDFILKMDVDYILNPYYDLVTVLREQIKDNDYVICDGWIGEGRGTGRDFLVPTNGFLCVSREALLKVGGYIEKLEGWGYDDDDIQMRLKKSGLNRKVLRLANIKFLYHNPHDHSKQTENYQNKNPKESWIKNKLISNEMLQTNSNQ